MSAAARKATTGPDMAGLKDDLQRALDARRKAENSSRQREEDSADDATTPRGHDAGSDTTSQASPTGKPRVTTARAMTVRMDPGEADDVDRFVLDLRDEAGQRLDKADVVRELIRLARFDPAVRRKLIRRLR